MKKRFVKLISIIAVMCIILSSVAAAAADIRLQLYFSPSVMNDVTGEILVDVMIKNFNLAVSDSYGDICGITFEFEYNTEQFDVKTDENGNVETIVDDTSLVKSVSDIECTIDKQRGRVVYTFMDSTLKDNLIGEDGKLFSFTLVSKYVSAFWNSADKYPLRFVPDTVGFVMYDLSRYKVSRLYNVEAIDIGVGPYNNPPSLLSPSVDKHLTFTDGVAQIDVDGTVIETDAAPFKNDDTLMIPVRYLCEQIGMNVEWNDGIMTAGAYTEYKTLKICIKDEVPALYINSTRRSINADPIEKDGRIYVPVDLVSMLYNGAEITYNSDGVTIYIP